MKFLRELLESRKMGVLDFPTLEMWLYRNAARFQLDQDMIDEMIDSDYDLDLGVINVMTSVERPMDLSALHDDDDIADEIVTRQKEAEEKTFEKKLRQHVKSLASFVVHRTSKLRFDGKTTEEIAELKETEKKIRQLIPKYVDEYAAHIMKHKAEILRLLA